MKIKIQLRESLTGKMIVVSGLTFIFLAVTLLVVIVSCGGPLNDTTDRVVDVTNGDDQDTSSGSHENDDHENGNDRDDDDTNDDYENNSDGNDDEDPVSENGDTPAADPITLLFPMRLDAVWVYSVIVLNQDAWDWTVDETIERGVITLRLSELDPVEKTGRIEVTGDHGISSPIREEYYIRWLDKRVEIATSTEGPWKATLDISGESWDGSYLLVRPVVNPDTLAPVPMKAGISTIQVEEVAQEVVSVSSGYDNSTNDYVTTVHTRRSNQHFSTGEPLGLLRSSSYWYTRIKNYEYGWGYSLEEVIIELVGYEIPQPDGLVLEGGDLNFMFIPYKPTNLKLENQSPSEVNLTWSDKSDNEEGFIIERKAGDDGIWSEIGAVPADTTTYIDTTVEPENDHYYRVLAYNAGGLSEPSNEVFREGGISPAAPSNLDAVFFSFSADFQRFELTWNDKSDNEDGFRLEHRKNEGEWSFLAKTEVDENYYDGDWFAGTSGDTFEFRARAFNFFGDSAWSNIAAVTIP